ncbi:hypothetical protein [Edaphobacter aggregans]|uniref:hypothetical protein n=1 Tax=Edaphobacter aggregans TaxID=570835 RepID=UPI0012FB0CF9|nr:hypothetical protein [Edaphobacter aggregans]
MDSEGVPVTKTRVVLADDHQSMIAKVRETLGEEFEIIGTAENGDRAIDLVL